MDIVNSLGGNMPQDRLDRIKSVWMERYGKNENEWLVFIPADGWVHSGPDDEPERESVVEFERAEDCHSDHPLCPTPEELGNRSKKTADYHLDQAARYSASSPAKSYRHKREAEIHNRIANHMFELSEDMLRKGR